MRTLARDLAVVLLGLTTACGGDDGGGGDADGGGDVDASGPSSLTFADDADVRDALAALDLPYLIAFSLTPRPGGAACPTVAEVAGGWTVEGGCTDDQGVRYDGSVDVDEAASGGGTDYDITFSGYGVTAASWDVFVDGTIDATIAPSDCGLPGPSPLETVDLEVTIGGDAVEGFGGFFPGPARSVEVSYDAFTYGWDLACDPATITASGTIGFGGRGAFAAALTRAEVAGCEERDALGGSATFEGANLVTVAFVGATACDGCLPYEIDGGAAAGSLCWED